MTPTGSGMARRHWLALAAVLASFGTAIGLGVRRSAAVRREAGESQRRAAVRRVVVAAAVRGPAERSIELYGEARPFASVTLYAKVSGYLRELRVDRGDRVQADQVLAVIDSPELDRQYRGIAAEAAFRRSNARRAESLMAPGAVSRRELEAEWTSAAVAQAALESFNSQRASTQLRAPFDGVVTARFADPGALVQNAANARSGALPVVTVSQISKLRVLVHVDQRHARLVRVGDPAEVRLPDGGPTWAANVSRLSGELHPRSRTMLVELQLNNDARDIVPGSFLRVRLSVQVPALVEVPAEALVLRKQRPFLAVVDRQKVHMRPITIGHLDERVVGISSGLEEGEMVALSAGALVSDGDSVETIPVAGPGR